MVSSHAQWCSRKCLGNYVHTRMLLAVLDERALLRSDPCNMNMQDSECGDIPTFTINDRHRKTDSAQRHCLTAINCCFLLTWLYIDHPTRGSGVASSLPTRITTPHPVKCDARKVVGGPLPKTLTNWQNISRHWLHQRSHQQPAASNTTTMFKNNEWKTTWPKETKIN